MPVISVGSRISWIRTVTFTVATFCIDVIVKTDFQLSVVT